MEIVYYTCTTAFSILNLENVIFKKVLFIIVNNNNSNNHGYKIILIKPNKRYIKLRQVGEFYPKEAF